MSMDENNEYIFLWRIENYSACYQETGERIVSPAFEVESLRGVEWCLKLYPSGNTKDTAKSISLYLVWKKLDKTIHSITVDFRLEILNEKNNVLKSKKYQHIFTEAYEDLGWASFMSTKNLLIGEWKKDVLTVRCCIKRDNKEKQSIFGSNAYTTIGVSRCCTEWDIIKPVSSTNAESIHFSISDLYKFDVFLSLLSEFVEICFLLKGQKSELPKKIIFKIIFCKRNGQELISKRKSHIFTSTVAWKFPDFITKKMIEDCKTDYSFYEFKLKCEIYCSKNVILTNSIETIKFGSIVDVDSIVCNSPATALSHDFRNLYNSNKYSDVKIRAEGKEFSAHKLVLQVRSPVFAAMFDQFMEEKKTGIVDIDDIDEETLRLFLEYLYTGTVDKMDFNRAMKLLVTADKYQVSSLVDVCVSFLKSVLSLDNVCEIINIADLVNCERLKCLAFSFIRANAAHILRTVSWSQWMEKNIKLASKILAELYEELATIAI